MGIFASLAFLLAASTHSSKAAPAPATLPKTETACTIVIKADIEAALGRSVSNPVEHREAAQSTCDYTDRGAEVTIALVHSNDALDAEAEVAELKKILPQGAVREATGVGTRAFFVDIPHAGAQLHVLRGEHDYLMVSILGFGDPAEVSDAALRIARKALARL
jgi:hypothetical protein